MIAISIHGNFKKFEVHVLILNDNELWWMIMNEIEYKLSVNVHEK